MPANCPGAYSTLAGPSALNSRNCLTSAATDDPDTTPDARPAPTLIQALFRAAHASAISFNSMACIVQHVATARYRTVERPDALDDRPIRHVDRLIACWL